MSIYVKDKKAILYRGEGYPAQLYKGDKKIAGYTEKTYSGKNINLERTYNEKPLKIKITSDFKRKNLFDKSLFMPDALKNEEPWGGYGNVVVSNKNVINMLKPNTTYTMSYDAECVAMPEGYENYQLIGTGYGFGFYSGVADCPSIITFRESYIAQVGRKVKTSISFRTNEKISDKASNYRMLGYTNKYEDAAGNRYFPSVIFRNIQIEEGDVATDYEEYKEDVYPTVIWNGREIKIPYLLCEGDYILVENGEVWLCCSGETTDITETETGAELLSLRTTQNITNVSALECLTDITVKEAD